jgi:hypothetical protein
MEKKLINENDDEINDFKIEAVNTLIKFTNILDNSLKYH